MASRSVAREVAVRIELLVMQSWLFMMWNMQLVLFNIMSVMVQVMCCLMSVVKLLVLPLVVNLVDRKRVVVGVVGAWLIAVDIMEISMSVVITEMASSMGVSVEVEIVVTIVLISVCMLVSMVLHWLHLENKVTS